MTNLKNIPDYVPGHGLLKGKRVVITAAAGTGIGFAAAKKCIEEGAQVFISDIHDGRLQKAQDSLEADTGQRPDSAICNVTVQEDVDGLMAAAGRSLGGIDVVINNAGLGGTANLIDMTDDQWMVVLDVTLNGCFRINRAAMQFMKEQGGGVIVNNASVLGWRAQKGQAHYAAAKAGVMALTRCAGVEGAEFGVMVFLASDYSSYMTGEVISTSSQHA